jgi:hypothetical protein
MRTVPIDADTNLFGVRVLRVLAAKGLICFKTHRNRFHICTGRMLP